jgi:hypothetical protein
VGFVSPPDFRVAPNGIDYITTRAHDTGWRTGGNTGPRPRPGLTAGSVYLEFAPGDPAATTTSTPNEGLRSRADAGMAAGCRRVATAQH